ncbi:MAG: SDR family NAD(P)-dependent oxidoreductase [Dehalococcoidia bacterium]|nr:SDR family NAD(P)-dependent oxidoreductase [Dehalococcoidia bacterium]
MTYERALVTGGAGFIGSHLCDELLDRGKQVTVVDNLSTGRRKNIAHLEGHPNFRFVQANVLDKEQIRPDLEKADVIYHLAAAVGVGYIHEHQVGSLETNVLGTSNLLELASHMGNKVVLASSSEVYGKSTAVPFYESSDALLGPTSIPRWSYACAKALDEFLALGYHKERGLPVVILRLFNTVGPRQSGRYGMVLPRFVRQAVTGEPITVYGDGLQKRSFTYVTDVVEAMAAIAEVPSANGEVFNVGSDSETSILELADLVRRVTCSGSELVHVPFAQVYGGEFEEPARRFPAIGKIQEYIDYHPTTPLASMVEMVAESIRMEEGRE